MSFTSNENPTKIAVAVSLLPRYPVYFFSLFWGYLIDCNKFLNSWNLLNYYIELNINNNEKHLNKFFKKSKKLHARSIIFRSQWVFIISHIKTLEFDKFHISTEDHLQIGMEREDKTATIAKTLGKREIPDVLE